MIDVLTRVSDFDALYLQSREVEKTKRRTRDWTIPRLIDAGIMSGRILSVGCGNGADISVMRSHGYEAFGVDNYEPIPGAAPWFRRASADEIPFPDKHFDALVCLEVIEHIPHDLRIQSAGEMLRVLKDSGVIILATPNRLFPADEHAPLLRFHSPLRDDTLSVREIEGLFACHAKPLTWAGYFAFERFGFAGRLLPLLALPFNAGWLHRSPLNPHLFLELRH